MRISARDENVARGSVLVVDDEPMILDLVQMILEGEGFTVTTASSAAGIEQVMQSVHPDVVVLDVGLPGLKGDRAVQAIRDGRGARQIAVILYSGESEEELRQLASRSGADDTVLKGSAPEVLISAVERGMLSVATAAARTPRQES